MGGEAGKAAVRAALADGTITKSDVDTALNIFHEAEASTYDRAEYLGFIAGKGENADRCGMASSRTISVGRAYSVKTEGETA